MEFKDKVRALRKNLNMTMDELAIKVGVAAPTIQRYESGDIKNVRQDKIKVLADALQTTPEYLMGWTDQAMPQSHEDIEIRRIQRARNNMSEKDKEKMMKLLELSFEHYFSDDYVEDDLDE